jgi:hypothetical protein
LSLLCLALAGGSAAAQAYVKPPCAAGSPPAFEDQLQSVWYRRFWTGDCAGLSALRCRGGSPYWNQVVGALTARAPAAQRAQVAARACRLGRQIGFEWTRPSAERRIDTHDLQAFNATLQTAPDVMTGLTAVETRVRSKLGS